MDVKADDGGVALPDPFRFVHKVPSEGDPGPAKEILPFAQYLFLLWLRQTAEHALIVQFGQRDIFCERKEPQYHSPQRLSNRFLPEVKMPASSKQV